MLVPLARVLQAEHQLTSTSDVLETRHLSVSEAQRHHLHYATLRASGTGFQ